MMFIAIELAVLEYGTLGIGELRPSQTEVSKYTIINVYSFQILLKNDSLFRQYHSLFRLNGSRRPIIIEKVSMRRISPNKLVINLASNKYAIYIVCIQYVDIYNIYI